MDNNVFEYVKWFIAIIGGAISMLLGGWDFSIKLLVLFMVFDYITGIGAAIINKEFNSKIGYAGVTKKIMTLIPIMMAYGLDVLTGQDVFRNVAIWFYIGMEGFSAAENLGKAGVPLPKSLTDGLAQLKGEGEKGLDEVTKGV